MVAFRTLSSDKWQKAYDDMFNGTNLYRRMLGLSQLLQNASIDTSSKEFSELLSKERVFSHNPMSGYTFTERARTIKSRISFNTYVWCENLYTNTEINEYAGILALNGWQSSNGHNEVLKKTNISHIGFGHAISKYHNIKYDDDGIYITQQFAGNGEPQKVKDSIEFTTDMCDHLNDYINLFYYNLKILIDRNTLYGNSYINPISLDPILNRIATEQLLLRVENSITQEAIEDVIVRITRTKFPNSTEITPIMIISPLYIPPSRLAKQAEGIPQDIKNKITDRKFNKFGINVALFDNKTFCASIIFIKDKQQV